MSDKYFKPANALMQGIRMMMQLTMLVGFFWVSLVTFTRIFSGGTRFCIPVPVF
jgi:hypothetical protein